MALASRTFGRGTRLVLAHGFTQNGRCWGPFADDLGADNQVVAVDLPGHGTTPDHYDRADLVTSGHLLADAGGTGVYVGYSMGGRVALHAALDRPDAVRALVLIGATAGLDDEADRVARRNADEQLAERMIGEGLPAFLDGWLANPLFAGIGPSAQQREARLGNRTEGLAASLRQRGTGSQQPLWDRLSELDRPVLVIAGDDDAKFCEVGRRLVAALPLAEMFTAPSTHAVHLECPTTSAERIRCFLTDHNLDD